MRFLTITILTCLLIVNANAQTSVSFSHLGNATFQNTYLNPALIPEGRLFIGLPVISGVHFHVNNRLSYNDLFTKEGGGTLVDISKAISNLQGQNIFSSQVNVNLLHVGIRLPSGPLVSFTANERVEADFLYPKEMVRYLWDGNAFFQGDEVKVSKIGLNASHFREFGLGIAAPVNEQLTVGLRGKFLVGMANISTPGNLKATLKSSSEAFQLDADWQNVALRTSGLDIYQGESVDDNGNTVPDLGSHLLMNKNKGFAIDLGATYHLNRYYTITGSLLDVGFISWKENIKNEVLNDTTFRYSGVSLTSIGDVRETIEDSLLSKFKTTDNFDPYKNWLPTRAYASWIYHYSQSTDFHVTVGSKYIQRQFKMLYGAGVTQKMGNVFTASLSATKLPQQFFNIGAAFAVNGGPMQLYMAADQVINFSVPDAKAFDFRVGLNIAIGAKRTSQASSFGSRPPVQGAKGYDTNVFLGKKVKTKKREGIYSIIKKQKRRELKNKRSERDNRVRKKSLTGREGGSGGSSQSKEVQTKSLTGRRGSGNND